MPSNRAAGSRFAGAIGEDDGTCGLHEVSRRHVRSPMRKDSNLQFPLGLEQVVPQHDLPVLLPIPSKA